MVIGRTRRTNIMMLTEIIIVRALQSGSSDSHLRFNMEEIKRSRYASNNIIRISLKNMLFDMVFINFFIYVNLKNGLLLRVLFKHHRIGNTRSLRQYWNSIKKTVPKLTNGFLAS